MDQENHEENIAVHFSESEDEEILNGDSPNGNGLPGRYDFADPKAEKKEMKKGLIESSSEETRKHNNEFPIKSIKTVTNSLNIFIYLLVHQDLAIPISRNMDQENHEENIAVHFSESEDEEILNGDSPNGNGLPGRYDFADPKAEKKEMKKGLIESSEGYANTGLNDTELDLEGINGTNKKHLSPALRMLVISIGFMTDAYDLFVIGIVLVIIRRLYGENTTAEALLATAVLVGTTIGQLFFGIMGDKIGRRKMFFITLIIITVMAFLCAFAFPTNQYIYLTLGLFRTILGFGIGGEYPLSATLAAEGATDPATRGRTMAIVFAMQGFGYLLAPLVVLLLVGLHVPEEYIWRITLGVGGLPGLCTLY
eukprot:TRINITY_DN4068_c0_g1_i1.p1 TRINITY_DN4068_c0_g1~~TRINITY_DN4068_c0_g1_i1.p1  ORF type:complete len:416 (-),score=23.44 TRINITY_DN4068_c0_g1_i1:109-1209(-)